MWFKFIPKNDDFHTWKLRKSPISMVWCSCSLIDLSIIIKHMLRVFFGEENLFAVHHLVFQFYWIISLCADYSICNLQGTKSATKAIHCDLVHQLDEMNTIWDEKKTIKNVYKNSKSKNNSSESTISIHTHHKPLHHTISTSLNTHIDMCSIPQCVCHTAK